MSSFGSDPNKPFYCKATQEEIERGTHQTFMQAYVRARLHRRLFLWFGASIVMTAATVAVVMTLFTPERTSPMEQYERLQRFVSHRFLLVWRDPLERDALGRSIAEDFQVSVRLEDPTGIELNHFGSLECLHPHFMTNVVEGGATIGRVAICDGQAVAPWNLVLLLFLVACGTLWGLAGVIARRIAMPLGQVASVARQIGEGKLDARVQIASRHKVGEVRVLADSINEMASRIQKQLNDQRELLAAVSHELRTPLGHVRILLEMVRDAGTSPKLVDDLEREVMEVDDLVGELLASSRLSFDTLSIRPVEALDVAARALERLGLPLDLLSSEDDSIPFSADATLLGRALANLLENAKRYGTGVACLEVSAKGEGASREIVFRVEDQGPGFEQQDLARVFDSFYRGEHRAGAGHASLGLGLSLVSRIAKAHGGRAWAENRAEGGAAVSFSVRSPIGEEPANKRSDSARAA
jgi:signal transduction histidine kinase